MRTQRSVADGFACFAASAILLCAPISAKAALLAYEGFDYPAGTSLTNASALSAGDSFGWADPWHASIKSFATNVAGSLGYSDLYGHFLLTDGGSMLAQGPPVPLTGNAQPSRSFTIGSLGGPLTNIYSGLSNGTYWFSFTAQWLGPTNAAAPLYGRKGDVQFRSGHPTNYTDLGSGTELVVVGRPNASQFNGTPFDTWTLWNGGDNGAATSSVPTAYSLRASNGASFILLRLDMDDSTNTADTTYMWINWTNLAVEPEVSTATATNRVNLTGINNIRLDANGASTLPEATNYVAVQFDEFRLGTTFADVTPYTLSPPHLSIVRDSGAGYFMRYQGAPEIAYRLLRAPSVTGPWSAVSTNTAPPSGFIEYHEASPPPDQAFYRVAQP